MAETWKKLAYETDVATLSDTTPQSVGTAGAAGTGTDASRDDHVHDLGADSIDSGLLIADDVIDSEHYAAASIDSEHLATLTADRNFGGFEATDMCLHNSATDPATPVLGKIYFKTGTLDCWVCTAIA